MNAALTVCVGLLIFSSPPKVHAAQWPANPIRLIVPYTPGGGSDVLARQYAAFAQQELHQNIIVENKPGAGTNIGSEYVARAEPDGYTLLWANTPLASNPSVGPVPGFDVQKSLAPVSLVTIEPGLLAANMKFPARNMLELLAVVHAHPSKYTLASAQLFLPVGMLEKYAGLAVVHIPYKGATQAMTDAISGQVDFVFAGVPALHTFARSGQLRPMAVTSDQRSLALPEVPTLKELGHADAVYNNWYAIFAPLNTPRDIVMKLAAASRNFVDTPGMKDKLGHMGYQLEASTPEQLGARLKLATERSRKFVSTYPDMFANK